MILHRKASSFLLIFYMTISVTAQNKVALSDMRTFVILFLYMQASAFEGSVFTHSDVKPGMATRAKIIAVDSFGAIVQFPGGVKALCPLRHMSEFEIVKPRKKFKVTL